MKVVQIYTLEVGDIFEGHGEGGYLTPIKGSDYKRIAVATNSFIHVVGYDSVTKNVHISGDYSYSVFDLDHITDHIMRGNLIYIGNVNGRS